MLIWNRQHLDKVLTVYVEHCNAARPHRGINLGVPVAQGERIARSLSPGGSVFRWKNRASGCTCGRQPSARVD
jgi:hypothetical protein